MCYVARYFWAVVLYFSERFQLVSVGCDGRILVWQLNPHQKTLRLTDGYSPSYLFVHLLRLKN